LKGSSIFLQVNRAFKVNVKSPVLDTSYPE
jgi:hypothetical protein